MEIVIKSGSRLTRSYLSHFIFCVFVEVPIQGSDDETDRPQAIASIHEMIFLYCNNFSRVPFLFLPRQ